jgi:DNA polymerase zeta
LTFNFTIALLFDPDNIFNSDSDNQINSQHKLDRDYLNHMSSFSSDQAGGDATVAKVRIVSIDYYMDKPMVKVNSNRVPVIRIFGTTPTGGKALLHIHQIYPYFYVKYSGSLEDVNDYCKNLAFKIDEQMKSQMGWASARSKAVLAILPVKGVPFYGFHAGYELFLKIYLFHPGQVAKVVALVQDGSVCDNQPVYESHIPYILQFLVDYNLYGMDYIDMSYARYRGNWY